MERKDEKTLDSASRDTGSRRSGRSGFGVGAIACVILSIGLWTGVARANEPRQPSPPSKLPEETSTSDPAKTLPAPSVTRPPVSKKKKTHETFTPTEKIEAESVISFPSDI